MKIKCDYCTNTYEDTMPNCPYCGAANTKRNLNDIKPRTIEQLKEWYAARHLPPEEVTRFFIGKDYRQPRAFGIYKDENGDFIVYKNKDTGERAIRYKGRDEEYAVNELYQKLKDEIVHQKHLNSGRNNTGTTVNMTDSEGVLTTAGWVIILLLSMFLCNGVFVVPTLGFLLFWQSTKVSDERKRRRYKRIGFGIIGVGAICIALVVSLFVNSIYRHGTGYYKDDNNRYYYYDNSISQWYLYNSDHDYWNHTETPKFYIENKRSKDLDYYYMGEEYGTWDTSKTNFSGISPANSTHELDVQKYEESHQQTSYNNNSDWNSNWDNDSDYDWDSNDSWDSGGTDWESDW